MPNEQQGSEPMSEEQLQHLLKAATPRPWGVEPEGMEGHYKPAMIFGAFDSPEPKVICDIAARPNSEENAELIVLAVNSYEGRLRSAPATLTDNEYLSAERIRLAKEQVDYELGKGKPEPQLRTEGSGQIGAPDEAAVARARECVSKIMKLADNLPNHRRVEAMINIIAAFSASENKRLEGELAEAKQQRNGYDSAHKIQAAATLKAESELTTLRGIVAGMREICQKFLDNDDPESHSESCECSLCAMRKALSSFKDSGKMESS